MQDKRNISGNLAKPVSEKASEGAVGSDRQCAPSLTTVMKGKSTYLEGEALRQPTGLGLFVHRVTQSPPAPHACMTLSGNMLDEPRGNLINRIHFFKG